MATLGLDLDRGLFLGIDFGTTNSVLSIYNIDKDDADTIEIDGGNIFPTAIQYETDPENENKLTKIFGAEAKEAAMVYPESTILSIKHLLGTDEKVNIIVDEKEYTFTPVQVAADILAHLKEKADEYVQTELNIMGEFSGCVITVPANSTDKHKSRTKEAAVLAGFDPDSIHLRLEPAASAISYAVNETSSKNVLVYDFGGGTFDACLLSIKSENDKEPEISILSTSGDNQLGGNDVDKIMMDIIYEEFKKLTNGEIDLFDNDFDDGISKRQKKVALVRLAQVANQAKERLSKTQSAKITLAPFLQEPKIVNINIEVTKENFFTHKRVNKLGDKDEVFAKFEGKSLEDMVDLTMVCIDEAINSAKLSANEVDEIFLVGGSSSLTLVEDKIKAKFNKDVYKSKISPALSISRGAAFYCNMIMMPTNAGPIMHETTIHSLGLEIAGRRYLEIVKSGIEIPSGGLIVEAGEQLMTNFDNVTSMAIVVYECTSNIEEGQTNILVTKEGMKRLAGTSLDGIPQAKKGEEKVKVVFNIGQDNMLKVTATSLSQKGVTTNLEVSELY